MEKNNIVKKIQKLKKMKKKNNLAKKVKIA